MLTRGRIQAAAQEAGLHPVALSVRRLDAPGPSIEIEPERYFYPASMIKTPLSVAALHLVASGELTLEDVYETTGANVTGNDKPSPFVAGYRGRLRDIIEYAIVISDNVATNMLYDIVGREAATRIVQETYGLDSTAFYRKLSGGEPLIEDPQWDGRHRNVHGVRDAARLFALIAANRTPFAGDLLATLLRQQFNDKLSLGLRAGDRFAHKTGDTDEVTHDGGILYTAEGRVYDIVVYTGLPSTPENNARFGPFMRALRDSL
ncbi:MAG: serine hydrolase [Candidatus Eremiobacteraeota bacterium]|nr:serine hydrolase [Candidatus Eremiobacteraeota bacterium]